MEIKILPSKNLHIETLRGIAIILVVIGHVIGIDTMGGMKVDDDSVFRYIYCLFENIRMPLFTVISGAIYAMHPLKKEYLGTFLIKKVRRLLIPMITVGTTYYLIQYFTPGTNMKGCFFDIWKIYIFPYTYFWYLPALFLVFGIVAIMEVCNLQENIEKWRGVLIISLIFCFMELYGIIPKSVVNLFAFKNALFLLPFFIWGLGLTRFNEILYSKRMTRFYLIGVLLGICLQQLHFFHPQHFIFYEEYKLKIIIGIISSAFLLNIKWYNRIFIYLAGYAYTIYLFHGFGTAGGRIILNKIGIHSEIIIFIFSSIIAIYTPIILDTILKNWKITRILFLGKSPVAKTIIAKKTTKQDSN